MRILYFRPDVNIVEAEILSYLIFGTSTKNSVKMCVQ